MMLELTIELKAYTFLNNYNRFSYLTIGNENETSDFSSIDEVFKVNIITDEKLNMNSENRV